MMPESPAPIQEPPAPGRSHVPGSQFQKAGGGLAVSLRAPCWRKPQSSEVDARPLPQTKTGGQQDRRTARQSGRISSRGVDHLFSPGRASRASVAGIRPQPQVSSFLSPALSDTQAALTGLEGGVAKGAWSLLQGSAGCLLILLVPVLHHLPVTRTIWTPSADPPWNTPKAPPA